MLLMLFLLTLAPLSPAGYLSRDLASRVLYRLPLLLYLHPQYRLGAQVYCLAVYLRLSGQGLCCLPWYLLLLLLRPVSRCPTLLLHCCRLLSHCLPHARLLLLQLLH
jgi:hypothetical protein